MIDLTLHTEKGTRTIRMPEQWDELSREQLSLIAKNAMSEVPKTELQVRLVVILTGMDPAELHNTSPVVMYEELVPLVAWVMDQCTLTRQLLPVIRNRFGRNLYGPTSELTNVRFSEFDSAEKELFLFNTDPDNTDQLYRFIACLYRPGKIFFRAGDDTSDRRHPFDPARIGRISKTLKRILPLNEAYAILLWYKGCSKAIYNAYRELFDGDGSDNQEFPDYFPIMRMIAKEGIYGDIDKVEQLNIYNAYNEMIESLKERNQARDAANQKS